MEKAVASIYSTFMQLFPKEKDFWEGLYEDEMEHLSFLADADYKKILKKGIQTTVFPPSLQLVEKTLNYAENIKKQIKLNPVSLEDAFGLALKLEESIVETFANELIANLAADVDKSVVKTIVAGERLHIDKIREMMIKKGFLKLV